MSSASGNADERAVHPEQPAEGDPTEVDEALEGQGDRENRPGSAPAGDQDAGDG